MTCTYVFALVTFAMLFCDGLLMQNEGREQPQSGETFDGAFDASSFAHVESKRGMSRRTDMDALCEFSELLSHEQPICGTTSNKRMAASIINPTYGDINMMAQYKATHKTINWPANYTKPHQNGCACSYRPRRASGPGQPPSVGFLIPKVASSSFRTNSALSKSGFVERMCYHVNKAFIMDPDVVRFAVVREPMSRFAAAFNQISSEVLEFKRLEYRSLLRDSPPEDPKKRFAQFLEDVLVPGKVSSCVWTTPQTEILLQIGPDDRRWRLPELDFLVSLDALDTYMPELRELLGLESQKHQPHISWGGYGAKLDSSEAWQALAGNPLAARRFCEQYALDYRVFGFNLPTWCSTAP